MSGTVASPRAAPPQPPLWLVVTAGAVALGQWAGPVAVGRAAGLNPGVGLLVGGLLAAAALAANAAIAYAGRLPVPVRVALMAGVAAALLGCFFYGARLAGWDRRAAPPEPAPQLPEQPPVTPTAPPPGPPPVPSPKRPPSHVDLAYKHGMSRLEDGPAAVTALAVAPLDVAVVVGYADGTTAVWPLDQPSFTPPWAGPRGDGAVRRFQFDDTGTLAFLTCDNGLVVAPLMKPPAAPLKIPGERPVVFTEPYRDRFAAVRNGRLTVRLIPTDVARRPPPPPKATDRFALCVPKMEVLPSGMKPDYPVLDHDPTFVAWHPAGKLLWGAPDGTITAYPTGPKAEVVTREHKAAVRAWAATDRDLVTGDDKGMVGYWPDRAAKPAMVWNSTAAVARFAFATWGREVAVADAAGGLSVWDLGANRRAFEVKRPAPVPALSFGPADDLLLLADGKGVEVWFIPELRHDQKRPAAR